MVTIYPAYIDTAGLRGTLPDVSDLATTINGATINRVRDAVIAIETQLGVKPAGIYATVRARLDVIENNLNIITGNFGSQNIVTTGGIMAGPAIFGSINTSLFTLGGIQIFNGISAPAVSDTGQAIVYYDSSTNKLKVSENGGAYADLLASVDSVAGGDLSSTYPNPTVAKIRGNTVATQSLGSGQDGYVLTWDNFDGYWKAQHITSGSVSLGGDVTGAATSNTVTALQHNAVAIQALGTNQDGYTLAWDNTDAYWVARPMSHVKANITNKITNYTILSSDYVVSVGTLSTPITLNLPSAPTNGDTYIIKDANGSAATNNITINGNGHNLDGFATFVLTTNYENITVIYNGSTWMVM